MEARVYDHRLRSIKMPFLYPELFLVPFSWNENPIKYNLSLINPILGHFVPGHHCTKTTHFNVANLSPEKLSPGETRVIEGARHSIPFFLAKSCDVSPVEDLMVLNSSYHVRILKKDGTFLSAEWCARCDRERQECSCDENWELIPIIPPKPGSSQQLSFSQVFSSVVFSHCGQFIVCCTPDAAIHLLDLSGRYHGCLGKEAEVPHGEGKIMRLPGENLFVIYFPGTVHVSIVKIDCEERCFEVVESFIFGKEHAISCIVPYGDSIIAFLASSSTEKLILQYRTNYQTGLEEIREIPTELNPGVKSACVLPDGQIAVYNPNEQRITTITFE